VSKHYRKNERIRAPKVNLVDEKGEQLGVLDTKEALRLAEERGLDLVEVGPNSTPPIAKILDYGKFIYDKEKKQKKEKKSTSELKTVRIGFRTGKHDLETKLRQINKFLSKGHRIRLEIKLRGRERRMSDMAKTKLMEFIEKITEPIIVEGTPKKTPFGWSIHLHYGEEKKNK
jgi:translation initiation factor IF-3